MKKQKKNCKIEKFNTIKMVFCFLLFCLFLYNCYYLLGKSLIYSNHSLTYSVNSGIDYNVCLKENDFYETRCLDKNMKYVSSLIDNIHLKFNYSFSANKAMNNSSVHYIIGRLIISDSSDNTVLFTKDYELSKETLNTKKNITKYVIDNPIDIDYSIYNDLANQFKKTYGISSKAKMEIHLIVKNSGHDYNFPNLTFEKNSDILVSFPLSESSISILTNNAITVSKDTVSDKLKIVISNYLLFGASICSLLLSVSILIYCIINIVKLLNNQSEYEKNLKKILKEYDRLIVESPTILQKENYNIIIINQFIELLDVHDNLKLPIIFNEVVKRKECIFYIKDQNDIYLFTMTNNTKRK